jgi:hypothetical protein
MEKPTTKLSALDCVILFCVATGIHWHYRPCDAVHGHPGLHRAQSLERGVYAHGQRPRYARRDP